jgi:hypothetical protein
VTTKTLTGTTANYNLSANGVTLTNAGTITGIQALTVNGSYDVVLNAGTILGGTASGAGVILGAPGAFTNQASALVSGFDGLLAKTAAVTLANAGTIAGNATHGVGAYLQGGGSIVNLAGGTISGQTGFEALRSASTVVNAGLIAGGGDAVSLPTGFSNRVVFDPGASFTGLVDGGNAPGGSIVSTLELASSASAGTLTGLGTQFVDFGQVAIDAGANWTLSGTNTLAGGVLTDAGTLTNTGSFSASGISLTAGALLMNQSGATIGVTAYRTAVRGAGDGVTVVNAGAIHGQSGHPGYGVYLARGGSITNQAGGTITGFDGVAAANGPDAVAVTVINGGLIAGNALGGYGVNLIVNGSLTNQSGGTIAGGFAVEIGASGTVVNAGSIGGNASVGAGVYLDGTSRVTNQAGGLISGHYGIEAKRLATVVNAGSIAGGGDAVLFTAGYANRLVIDPGAGFSGTVDGGNGIGGSIVSTLELAGGTASGTISGLGSQFVDFSQIAIDSSANWTLSGANTLATHSTVSSGVTLVTTAAVVDSGTLTNTGGFSNAGITLTAGALLINAAGASMTNPYRSAVTGIGGAATVSNAGSIAGSNTVGAGVSLTAGGSVTNSAGGTISGFQGISGSGAALTVVNAGLVSGRGGVGGEYGIALSQGGFITNQSSGFITGYSGILASAAATVVNAGTIGHGALGKGIYLLGGGTITNQASGTIAGHFAIRALNAAVTVVNAGTIESSSTSVVLAVGFANRLVDDPGAAFLGPIDGGNTLGASIASTLELAAGTAVGTLAGLGTQFIDFAQVTIDNGAAWTLRDATLAAGGTLTNAGTLIANGGSGTDTIAGAFVNTGTILVENGGTETLTAPTLTGAGSMLIASGGALVLDIDSVGAGQTIDFIDATGVLTLGAGSATGGFAGTIGNFVPGDTIIVDSTVEATFTQSGSVVTFQGTGDEPVHIAFATEQMATEAVSDGALRNQALCFLPNTLIATPGGEVPVQSLAVGDAVLTAGGRVRPIVWIGRGRVLAARGRRGPATPVIVRKGALGPNQPHRDLRVTKGHAFFLDGVLIPIEFLVNHRSILWDDQAREVELYHIELESHDVLLANNAAAESYRDDGNRWLFQNANTGWDQPAKAPCAPILTGGARVDAVWRRLLDRSGPRPGLILTDDPNLHLVADGQRLEPINRRPELYVFRLPKAPSTLRIVSRSAVPQELGIARDARPLGVALQGIVLCQGMRQRAIDANNPCLSEGFHAYEPGVAVRWTNGDAVIPPGLFDGLDGPCLLRLHLNGAARYRDEDPRGKVA